MSERLGQVATAIDSCRYLTKPLGHLIFVSTETRHRLGRYPKLLNLTVSFTLR